MNPVVVIAGVLLVPVVFDLVRRGSFRRLAVRNITRRKGEAVLVVVGSLLGTAIITASFLTGDTIDAAIRDVARTRLGPIDEIVEIEGTERLDALESAITATPLEGTDGVLTAVRTAAAVATVGPSPRAEPYVDVVEYDFDRARQFGADADTTGLADAGPTPSDDEVVLDEFVAGELDVAEGDQIDVFALGAARRFTVRDVVPEVGLAGGRAMVAPGTIEDLLAQGRAGDAQPPTGIVFVSNDGGVFDGAAGSDAVADELERRVADVGGVSVRTEKQDVLDEAESAGTEIASLFTAIGGFSVIAGILLLVNLFVMLAEERKTELGMMRAVGLKRNRLMRAFAMEGAVYAVVASIVGAVVGIGVGWVITEIARGIVAADDPELNFYLAVDPSSLVAGAGIGLVISMLTVWGTSARISSLNVIRAIRDLPEPRTRRTRLRSAVLGALGVVVGGVLFSTGKSSEDGLTALIGPALAAFSAIPLLSRLLPRRVAVVSLSAAALVWGIACFTALPDVFENSDLEVFVVQGVILVAAAVAIVSSIDHLWVALADRLSRSGRGLALRLGLAYPLDRKFRTGMLLAMYAIVVFTITFMAVLGQMFLRQGPTLTDEVRAGYDVFVDSNPANPLSVQQLEDQEGIEAAAALLVAYPEFTTDFEDEPTSWAMSGFDASLLERGLPVLEEWDPRYGSERDVFEAVLADPSLAIVPGFFLSDEAGPADQNVTYGDEITVIDPVDGEERVLSVVALGADDWLFNGVLVSASMADEFLGDAAVTSRHYVAVADGTDPDRLSASLNATFLANGADARTFQEEIDGELAEQNAFFRLMEGYLALGLLIGIAGLGVVMVRAVRERRREVGMLRALGFPSAVVRRAFLTEALFIAAQGILIGIGLGMLSAYQLMTNSDAFGEGDLAFSVPWPLIGLTLVVPLVASLAAAVAPAAQAARVKPAVALRLAD